MLKSRMPYEISEERVACYLPLSCLKEKNKKQRSDLLNHIQSSMYLLKWVKSQPMENT